eukprot:763532-Hanusia_phi.AAC.4
MSEAATANAMVMGGSASTDPQAKAAENADTREKKTISESALQQEEGTGEHQLPQLPLQAEQVLQTDQTQDLASEQPPNDKQEEVMNVVQQGGQQERPSEQAPGKQQTEVQTQPKEGEAKAVEAGVGVEGHEDKANEQREVSNEGHPKQDAPSAGIKDSLQQELEESAANLQKMRGKRPRMCEHDRKFSQCKECGGPKVCEHNRQKRLCRDCGGTGIEAFARIARAQEFVSMRGEGADARTARGPASACTTESADVARTAKARGSVSMVGSSDSAKSARGRESVNTTGSNASARNAEDREFVSTTGRGVDARIVRVQPFVSTTGKRVNARTVEVLGFASIIESVGDVRNVVDLTSAYIIGRRAIAKIARASVSASTTGDAADVKNARAQVYASTIGKDSSAKSARDPPSATIVGSDAFARSAKANHEASDAGKEINPKFLKSDCDAQANIMLDVKVGLNPSVFNKQEEGSTSIERGRCRPSATYAEVMEIEVLLENKQTNIPVVTFPAQIGGQKRLIALSRAKLKLLLNKAFPKNIQKLDFITELNCSENVSKRLGAHQIADFSFPYSSSSSCRPVVANVFSERKRPDDERRDRLSDQPGEARPQRQQAEKSSDNHHAHDKVTFEANSRWRADFARSLVRLHLYKNDLSVIPDEISNMKKLQELNVFNNKIIKIPPTLGEISSLREVNFADNKLKTIPSIDGLKFLSSSSLISCPSSSTSPCFSFLCLLLLCLLLLLLRYLLPLFPCSHEALSGRLTNLTRLALFNNKLVTASSSLNFADLPLGSPASHHRDHSGSQDLGAQAGKVTAPPQERTRHSPRAGKLRGPRRADRELSLTKNWLSSLPDDIGKGSQVPLLMLISLLLTDKLQSLEVLEVNQNLLKTVVLCLQRRPQHERFEQSWERFESGDETGEGGCGSGRRERFLSNLRADPFVRGKLEDAMEAHAGFQQGPPLLFSTSLLTGPLQIEKVPPEVFTSKLKTIDLSSNLLRLTYEVGAGLERIPAAKTPATGQPDHMGWGGWSEECGAPARAYCQVLSDPVFKVPASCAIVNFLHSSLSVCL